MPLHRATHIDQNHYDLVVVGSGIYGACITLKASQAGYRVLLLEAEDFGSGASANCMKVLHGGFRYLQHLNFKRMRRSIRSRRFFQTIAPHTIDVQAFAIPLKGIGTRSPLVMSLALGLNAIVSWDRNQGLDEDQRIPIGEILYEDDFQKEAAGFKINSDEAGGKGAAVWHEAVATQIERLIVEVLKHATASGAAALNYARVQSIKKASDGFIELTVDDKHAEQTLDLRTKWVVDATGSHLGEALTTQQLPTPYARSNNVIINNRFNPKYALGLPVRDDLRDRKSLSSTKERMLFFVPWQDKTMVGTFYAKAQQQEALTGQDKAAMLADINSCLFEDEITSADVCGWHHGYLPSVAGDVGSEIELRNASELTVLANDVPSAQSSSGIILVSSVKFATAPAVADDVLKLLMKRGATKGGDPSPTDFVGLPPAHNFRESQLRQRFGIEWPAVESLIDSDTLNGQPLGADHYEGEARYAIRHEMAVHLSDLLFRRLGLMACAPNLFALAQQCGKIMQQELGWDDGRLADEIATLRLNDAK